MHGRRSIPEDYRILFLQGGGVGLFSAIPLNFIGRSNQHAADYIIAGSWSNSAAREAEKYANKVHRITPPEGNAHHCMYSLLSSLWHPPCSRPHIAFLSVGPSVCLFHACPHTRERKPSLCPYIHVACSKVGRRNAWRYSNIRALYVGAVGGGGVVPTLQSRVWNITSGTFFETEQVQFEAYVRELKKAMYSEK